MKKIIYLPLLALILALGNLAFAQNYALDFDGIDDKVGFIDNEVLNPTFAITVEAWINADSWKSSIWAGTIVSKQGTNPDRGYCLTVGEGGKAEFTVAIGNQWKAVATPAVMGLSAWYHIAGVYDGATISIYINGVLQNSMALTGNINPSNGVALNFADNPTWSGRFFDGRIDEVRIWNIGRTAEEILENMGTEIDPETPGLIGYWDFNEGTGNTLNDLTENENNGFCLNMNPEPVWVDGFVPATTDIGVIGIASPSILGQGFTANEKIAVEVKNFANQVVESFQLSYYIDDGETVSETVNVTIEPFETYIYEFSNTVNLSGLESIEITAICNHEDDVNTSNDSITVEISQSLEILVFDEVRHNFGSAGQTHLRTVYMPESLDEFSELKLLIDLKCPSGGCDLWDQFGRIGLLKDGEMWELARYITPYAVACGGWEFDITDFRNLLVNRIDLESYIQVWGSSGWLVDAKLIVTPGTPAYTNIKVDKLWSEDYWVYGDPEISHDLPEINIFIDEATDKLKVRLTNTGHGQGNTSNAAEFMNVDHILKVGDAEIVHVVWKNDCNQNSCSPQSGTWQISRAGWCPGQDVQPHLFDLNGLYTPGENLSIDYILHDYTNLLNSGYNDNTHTEPFLRVHGYLISYLDDDLTGIDCKLADISNLKIYPNPAKEQVQITGSFISDEPVTIEIYNMLGNVLVVKNITPNNGSINENIALNNLKSGVYFVRISSENNLSIKKLIIE
ncbi:MAG: T9SS type A sorting domain-containing protein [Bacteroidales bacterium]|nr:T9SS type A sorting domain-containing protein [Bacteroidales bacterium]